MIYEWDLDKATGNLKKHRVSFDEAKTVFMDPFALTFDDPEHSSEEARSLQSEHRRRAGFCLCPTLIAAKIESV